jgi:AAA+ ATPase superfamily predicted ATPase
MPIMVALIGRRREQRVLEEALASPEAELVAVYGRRRVGKTFLIRQYFAERLTFELVGIHDGSMRDQLRAFASSLGHASGVPAPLEPPKDWHRAFEQLVAWLEPRLRRARTQKQVVFLDEVPWLATRRSGFLSAFEHFWNGWASRQPNLVVVICGSAASWMIRKVVRQRGGLHNRVTRSIRLEPFTLGETEAYLRSRGSRLDRYSILELYMTFGGIPHYLKQVRATDSAAQSIDRVCFARDGLLRREFENLYASLFEKAERHEEIVRALGRKRGGLSRQELIEQTSLASGGATSKVLSELVESGFIARTPQLGREVRDARYRLTDEYSLFYLTWIEPHRGSATGAWMKKRGRPRWRSWTGLSFEGICLKHVDGIKRALGIAAVETVDAGWQHRPTEEGDEGAQIDLLIDRADRAINLCEMKFAEDDYAIDAAAARDLERKRRVLVRVTGTRKTVLLTVVTTFGLRDNDHARRLGIGVVTMDALFDAD